MTRSERPDVANSSRLRSAGALSGVLAAGAGFSTGEAVAVFVGAPSPVVAIGNAAIDLAPRPVVDFGISTFGTADKPVLIAGVVVVTAMLAAIAGAVGVRRPLVALAAAAGLGLLGVLAAALGRDVAATPLVRVLPAVTALVVSVAALGLLLRVLRELGASAPVPMTEPSATSATEVVGDGRGDELPDEFDRRRFVTAALAVGAVGVVGGAVARSVGVRQFTSAVQLPIPDDQAAPVPPGASFPAIGMTPFLTPNNAFYRIDTALSVPRIDARTWRLRVHGMVDRELELDFDQLVARRLVERDITLTCVDNPIGGDLIGNARWIGAPIAELLAEAGVQAGADAVKSTAVDGFTIGTPLAALTDGRDALLAVGMNGAPLPPAHGFPVRMVVPGLYGFVSATKWLVDIEVTRFVDFEAFWTERGWAERAPIKTASRIDRPTHNDYLNAGPITFAGYAWAPGRGISRVELRANGGPWQEAELAAEDTVDTWRQWRWEWDAPVGEHVIEVRATDGTGAPQTSEFVPPFPDGATGLHQIVVGTFDELPSIGG